MGIFEGNYPFMTAYLKGEEAHIISSEHVDKLLRVGDVLEAIEALRGTDIGNYLSGYLFKSFDEMDERLWLYFDSRLKVIKYFRLIPDKMLELLNAYVVKYDVLNIKASLQSISSGKRVKLIPLGTIHELGFLDELGKVTATDDLINILSRSGLGAYTTLIRGYEGVKDVEARLLIGAALDREYFRSLLKLVRRMPDRTILTRVIGTMKDMANLRIIFRSISGNLGVTKVEYTVGDGYLISGNDVSSLLTLKPEDVPDKISYAYRKVALEVVASLERSKNVTVIQEIIDREEFKLIKEILAPVIMSPLVVAYYLILKEVEIRNLRMVFRFMFDRHPLEEIRNYLVVSS
jgi:vacuolar-type H+-ATPase subunit C/Vma6